MQPMQYVLLFVAFAAGCAGSVVTSQYVEEKGEPVSFESVCRSSEFSSVEPQSQQSEFSAN